jgi:hypothetical protein
MIISLNNTVFKNRTKIINKISFYFKTPLLLRSISPERGENSRKVSEISLMCLIFSPILGEWPKAEGVEQDYETLGEFRELAEGRGG